MNIKKCVLSLILMFALVLTIFPSTGIGASASYTDKFQFGANGKFTVMQLADIQDGAFVNSRSIALITNMIARYNPDLIVFTGDNVKGSLTKTLFKASVNKFLQPIIDAGVPFAVTFGNHDDEGIAPSKDTQYDYYKSRGGNLFVDHDVSYLTGAGNGAIPIYPNGQTNSDPAFQVYLMDSGTYASSGGYDCPYTDQIDYYIERSELYPTLPSLWFMHIIVPDVYSECMTTTNNGTGVSQGGNGTPFSGNSYWLQPSRINWAKCGAATTLAEIYKEGPCPANLSTYQSTVHRSSPAYGSKTLYEAWVAHGNMLGTYYGHDHKNSFVATTKDGIDIGFGKAATLKSYNDGNPGSRIYELDVNGTYTTYNVTESDLTKAQIFFDANGGTGEMFPQFIAKNSTAAIRANTYTNGDSTFLGWATSPMGTIVYENGANYSIGTNDTTLYAKWASASNITFNANGGIGGLSELMPYGASLTAPMVEREGHTLLGWSPEVPSKVPAEDTIYTAQWSVNSYTIIFDAGGGIGGTSVEKQYGTPNTPPVVTRTGYNFTGWLPVPSETVPASNTTYTAQWTKNDSYLKAQPGSTTLINTSENLIYGLKNGISQKEFEDDFITVDGDASLVITPTGQGFGTGTKVDLVDKNTLDIIQTFIVIIFGDVNGDGNIDGFDAGIIADVENHRIPWNPDMASVYILAGDLNGDGNIDSIDAGIMIDVENRLLVIDQVDGALV